MMDKGEPSSNMCKLVVTNRYFFLETFRFSLHYLSLFLQEMTTKID